MKCNQQELIPPSPYCQTCMEDLFESLSLDHFNLDFCFNRLSLAFRVDEDFTEMAADFLYCKVSTF